MAKQFSAYVTGATAAGSVTDDDLFYLVDSPGGTPAPRKVTALVLKTYVGPGSGGSDESRQVHTSPGSTEAYDYATARTHYTTLDSASMAASFTGWPTSGLLGRLELWFNHGTTTTSRTITLPAGTKTPMGMPLAIPTTIASAEYCLIVTTWDAGSTLYAQMAGSEWAAP